MSRTCCQLAVIGAGAAGLGALAEALRLGCDRLLLFDQTGRAGGVIRHAFAARNIPFLQDHAPGDQVARELEVFFSRTGIPITTARVCAVSQLDGRIGIRAHDGRQWSADRLIVATGAKPKHPQTPGLPEDFVPPWLPWGCGIGREGSRAVAVIGAGDVAFDQARRLRARGAQVTIVCRAERPRAPEWLQQSALREGVRLWVGCALVAGEARGEGAVLHLQHQAGSRSLQVDHLLAAIGRSPALMEGAASLPRSVCRIVGDAAGRGSSHLVAALGDGCTAASELLKGGIR